MKEKYVLFLILCTLLLTGCEGKSLLTLIDATNIPVINSPSELPVSLQGKNIVWNGKMINLSDYDVIKSILPTEKIIQHFALSNDSQYIAYSTWDIDKGADQVYKVHVILMNLQTGEKRILVKQEDVFPNAKFISSIVFFPDDKKLLVTVAFSSTDGSDSTDKFLEINLENGDYQWITVEGHIYGFDSSDISIHGQILDACVIITNNKWDTEICVFDQQGNLVQHFGKGVLWGGKFLPDGNYVVYDSEKELYKAKVDGSEIQKISPCSKVLLVTEDSAIVVCLVSQKPDCQGVFVVGLDGSNFRRIGFVENLCSTE
ncbi:MAG: hypothetical protein Q8R87_03390 [Anaerolineaceae bacterium]|jgi:hypothetical protein|nr:hypothetical protein [Anaerolineaceae bacterium]